MTAFREARFFRVVPLVAPTLESDALTYTRVILNSHHAGNPEAGLDNHTPEGSIC